MKIGVLIKTTTVDYPSCLACAVFLTGCNLRCPYCYNTTLVTNQLEQGEGVTLQEIIDHLEKRKNVLKGLVISGGEALLSSNLIPLIKAAKSLGYKVKLDTNGTLPLILQDLLNNSELCPDFIALDVKTSPQKTALLTPFTNDESHIELTKSSIKQTINILSSLPAEKREFRTVLVPTLVTKEDIFEIAKLLPKDASWQFAQFRNENCLDTTYNEVLPYTDKEAMELVEYARTLIPGANLR